MQPLGQVLAQAEQDRLELQRNITKQEEQIEEAISYFQGLKEIFVGQRDLFLKKLNSDFDAM